MEQACIIFYIKNKLITNYGILTSIQLKEFKSWLFNKNMIELDSNIDEGDLEFKKHTLYNYPSNILNYINMNKENNNLLYCVCHFPDSNLINMNTFLNDIAPKIFIPTKIEIPITEKFEILYTNDALLNISE